MKKMEYHLYGVQYFSNLYFNGVRSIFIKAELNEIAFYQSASNFSKFELMCTFL